jgi:glycerol-3-phosphate acyltransferase PlsY
MIAALMAALGGYLLGSIPFGFLLGKAAGLGDIRSVGSGNIGATNVLRTGRKDIAALTLLLDGGKGVLAVLLAQRFTGEFLPLIAGISAVAGHCTTIWMGGRGGKGVATGLGAILGWAWPVGALCCLIWVATAAATRLSSAAALAAFIAAPVLMLTFETTPEAIASLLVSALVIFRHRGNIERLLAGTEPRIGAGR